MINSSLQAFASNVQKAGRISFGDVKRLQRDILPDGISSRAEAELLLTLDQTISRADRAFADWLVAMMVDFVVWGVRPTGTVDAETAAWLSPFLVGQRTTKTMRRLARELAAEADHGGDPLPSPALNAASEGCTSLWIRCRGPLETALHSSDACQSFSHPCFDRQKLDVAKRGAQDRKGEDVVGVKRPIVRDNLHRRS
jgi:hypothetical protein